MVRRAKVTRWYVRCFSKRCMTTYTGLKAVATRRFSSSRRESSMMMKNSLRLAFASLGFLAVAAPAQSVRLAARPDSKLWLEGTSNLLGWSCRAVSMDAWVIAASGHLAADPDILAGQLENVTIRVPVESLKCGNGR